MRPRPVLNETEAKKSGLETTVLLEYFTTDVIVDKEKLIKFWKSSGSTF